MTPMQHEAQIDLAIDELCKCANAQERRAWGDVLVAAVLLRNSERTPAQVEQLERERGLRP